MGIFNGSGGYKNPLIPNCKIDPESKTITCDAQKILGEQTIKGQRQMTFTVDNGKLIPLDDGGQQQPVIEEVKSYIRKNFKR